MIVFYFNYDGLPCSDIEQSKLSFYLQFQT